MMEENTPNKLWITTHINGFAHCCQLKFYYLFSLFINWGVGTLS